MPKITHSLTEQQVRQAHEAYLADPKATLQSAAKSAGVNRWALDYLFKKYGLAKKKQGRKKGEVREPIGKAKQALILRGQGLSNKEISRLLGTSTQNVHAALCRWDDWDSRKHTQGDRTC